MVHLDYDIEQNSSPLALIIPLVCAMAKTFHSFYFIVDCV